MKRNSLVVSALAAFCAVGVLGADPVPGAAATAAPVPVTQAQIEIMKLQLEVLRKTRENTTLQTDLLRVQGELQAAQRKTAQADALATQLAAAEQAKDAAEAKSADLSRSLQQARKETKAQADEAARLKSELSIEKKVSDASVKQAKAIQKALMDAKAKHAQELEAQAKARTAQEKAGAEREAKLAQTAKDLEAKLAQAAKDLEAKAAEADAAGKARSALETKLRDLEAATQAREQLEAQVAELKTSLKDKESVLALLQKDLQEKQSVTDASAALKARQDELEQEVARARDEVSKLNARAELLETCRQALVHAQKAEWLDSLAKWKTAVDKGWTPDEDSRKCIAKAFDAGVLEIDMLRSQTPQEAPSKGMDLLSLDARLKDLQATHAAIVEKIGR